MNLKLLLEKAAKQYAGKTAIVMGERRVSYAELDRTSNQVANALIEMKVRKGDRVAMLLSNSPEFASLYFGIIKAGAIAVPLDTRYRIPELLSVCGNCRPKVLVTESPIFESLVPALSRFDYIERVITLSTSADSRFITYQQIVGTASPGRPTVTLSPGDIATISYSGGPAIHPKGAAFTQRGLVTHVPITAECFRQTAEDVTILFALPLCHVFGMNAGLFTPIYAGSTIVIVPGTGISIGSVMEAIEREKGTILHAVPYIYALAIKLARCGEIKSDLSSLRLCVSGGAPLSVSIVRRFEQYYGRTIADFYGLTESTCQVACQTGVGRGRLGSCGKPVSCFKVKIVDDSGKELPAGHHGEIVVKGNIMKGYYNNPQATAAVIRNGWLHTGDVGKLDKDGFLYITGRKKRMIVLKGQNVYPSEVEEVMATHPKIAETRVIGVADRLRGEVVRTYIRLKEGQVATEQEIRRFCQERMADYRVPRQMIFTDLLPEAVTARADKRLFKDLFRGIAPLPYHSPKKKQGYGC